MNWKGEKYMLVTETEIIERIYAIDILSQTTSAHVVMNENLAETLKFSYSGTELTGETGKIFKDLVNIIRTIDKDLLQDTTMSRLQLRFPRKLLQKQLRLANSSLSDAEIETKTLQILTKFQSSIMRINGTQARRFAKFPILREFIYESGKNFNEIEICIDKSFVALARDGKLGIERIRRLIYPKLTK